MDQDFLPKKKEKDELYDHFDLLKVRLMKSCVNPHPYPHIFIDKALNEFILRILWNELPKFTNFDHIQGGGNILKNYDLECCTWKAYDNFIRDTLVCLLPKFNEWFEIKNRQLLKYGMSCSWIRQYESFVCFTDPDHGVPPHTDGDSSILNILTVLGYPDDSPVPVTNFFSKNIKLNSFTPTTTYSPSRGSLFVWLNLENAYHGVIEKTLRPGRLTHVASLESYEKNNA